MDRPRLEERLTFLSVETNQSLEAVKLAWEALCALDPTEKDRLTADTVSKLSGFSAEESLQFLIAAVSLGLMEQRWAVYNPKTGWVLEESKTLGGLKGEKLLDPFSKEFVLPDLELNTFVYFSVLEDSSVYRPNAYEGSWDEYVRTRLAPGFQTAENGSAERLAGFRVYSGYELGKISLPLEPHEEYWVVCLETCSSFKLSVQSRPKIEGSSFFQKMEAYKNEKVQQSSSYQILDLVVTAEGFEQPEYSIPPGRGVLWVENRTGRPLAISVWKMPLKSFQKIDAPVLKGRAVLNSFYFQRKLASQDLPMNFHHKVSGQVFLFADLKESEAFFREWEDFESFRVLDEVNEMVSKKAHQYGGSVFKKVSDTLHISFSDALSAVSAAMEIEALFAQTSRNRESLKLRIGLCTGTSLVVNTDSHIDFFGDALNFGQELLSASRPQQIWVSAEIYNSSSIAELLTKKGFKVFEETVLLKAKNQKMRVLACSRTPSLLQKLTQV